ncbi:MAG TPA: hypothetical protein VH601_15530 [Bryobacteraceae bacterium]|jgi:hypothetical protein
MKRVWQTPAKILTGLFVAAVCAMPQTYTISARPGVVNYIDGSVLLNGQPVSATKLKSTFLNANDTLSTEDGKAEVLLTPGVFLRIGDNSQIRMVSPSLTDIQVQLERGQAMIEVDDLVKDNRIAMLNHGGTVVIEKTGLYRFSADPAPTASVIDGKAEVNIGDRKVELGKGRQAVMDTALKSEKFDRKKEDDLYAWSNVRSEYNAAASYQAAKNVSVNSYGGSYGGWGGLGFGGWYGPGWYWDSGFNSWAWLPMNGAFYSPFGYGFYGPGVLPYAPVIVAPLYGGGGFVRGQKNPPAQTGVKTAAVPVKTAAVPISPKNPPALGMAARSPAANQAARNQAARSLANSGGFRTATGAPAANFGGGRVSGGGVRMSGPSTGAGRTASGNVSGGGGMRGGGGSMPSAAGRAPGGAPSASHK